MKTAEQYVREGRNFGGQLVRCAQCFGLVPVATGSHIVGLGSRGRAGWYCSRECANAR